MHYKFTNGIETKEVKHGFSWTIFFFGWIALAIRGQAKQAIISFLTFNLAACYFMFTANTTLARDMIRKGWKPVDNLPSNWV